MKNWIMYLVLFVFVGIISGCCHKVTVPKTSVVKKPTIKITSITISPAVSSAVHKETTGIDFLSDDFYDESEEVEEIYDQFETWNRGVL